MRILWLLLGLSFSAMACDEAADIPRPHQFPNKGTPAILTLARLPEFETDAKKAMRTLLAGFSNGEALRLGQKINKKIKPGDGKLLLEGGAGEEEARARVLEVFEDIVRAHNAKAGANPIDVNTLKDVAGREEALFKITGNRVHFQKSFEEFCGANGGLKYLSRFTHLVEETQVGLIDLTAKFPEADRDRLEMYIEDNIKADYLKRALAGDRPCQEALFTVLGEIVRTHDAWAATQRRVDKIGVESLNSKDKMFKVFDGIKEMADILSDEDD